MGLDVEGEVGGVEGSGRGESCCVIVIRCDETVISGLGGSGFESAVLNWGSGA